LAEQWYRFTGFHGPLQSRGLFYLCGGSRAWIKKASATSPLPRRRWMIASLLGFGVLVNYFDRVNLSVSQMRFIPPSASPPFSLATG